MKAEEYHQIRESLGYTQQQLADEIGVDIRTIQRREGNEVPVLAEAAIAIHTLIAKRELNELMMQTKNEVVRAKLKNILKSSYDSQQSRIEQENRLLAKSKPENSTT